MDFNSEGATSNPIELDYKLYGPSRDYLNHFRTSDCESQVTGVSFSDTSQVFVSSEYNFVKLRYQFDRSQIALSNIWDSSLSQMQLCHIVQLGDGLVEGSTGGTVLAEHRHVLTIDVDVNADFGTVSALGAPTVTSETVTTTIASFVEVCKCGGMNDLTCNTNPLNPNVDLFVCVKATAPFVQIDALKTLVSPVRACRCRFLNARLIS